MKIVSTSYTRAQGFRALKRLHKAIIYNRILHVDLHKMYKALIHLERYMERLNQQKSAKKIKEKKFDYE
ncbi:hypothetical protein [Acinetobacter albensis]|uniref:Uncharacterized protein n=2 Tax=Acinetobacter TaxID=469 RepID=A0A1C4GRY4_9GAMM|nr:hypothetical protein [Acinetobacter albensis]SCC70940.1 hypothetical protein GA0116959_10226 [Acinetobacter albensis]